MRFSLSETSICSVAQKPTPHTLRIKLVLMMPMLNQSIINTHNRQPRNNFQSKICLCIRWQKIRQLWEDQVCLGAALDVSAGNAVAGLIVQADGGVGGWLEVETPRICVCLLLVSYCENASYWWGEDLGLVLGGDEVGDWWFWRSFILLCVWASTDCQNILFL